MTTYAVDASVAAEYLLRTHLGLKITETLQGAQLIAPELLDVEVLSILRGALLRKKLSEERVRLALEDFLVWPIQRLPHSLLLQEAWRYRHTVSAYDSMYVATARTYNVTLLTADGPLSRAPSLGIVVQNIRLA